MDRIEKAADLFAKPVDASADIALINQHSVKELTPEEVYCFAVKLCDNEVDRDFERFDKATLGALAKLFLGKTGIFDHSWSAKGQIARLYKAEVVQGDGKTQAGDQYYYLRGYAYMMRTEENANLIAEIEAGIKKEVSVGCAVSRTVCSICGAKKGDCRHEKGQRYEGKLCFFTLKDPVDAYEWSFVAVPAQPAAGVTKSAKDVDVAMAFSVLMEADLDSHQEQVKDLLTKLQMAALGAEERKKRARIREKYAKLLENNQNI